MRVHLEVLVLSLGKTPLLFKQSQKGNSQTNVDWYHEDRYMVASILADSLAVPGSGTPFKLQP